MKHRFTSHLPALVMLLLPAIAVGQSPPRITFTDGELRLSWDAFSDYYEVQVSETLEANHWRPRVYTEHETAKVPVSEGDLYFRVASSPPNRTTVPDARRLQILDEIGAKIRQTNGGTAQQHSAELADFLSQYPELEAIGTQADTSVHARFLDGRALTIINNRRPATPEELAERIDLSVLLNGGAPQANPLREVRGNHVVVGLPESRRAILLKAEGLGLMSNMIGLLRPAFETGGYQVVSGDGTLDNYMAIGNVEPPGVVYLDSHSSEIPVGYSDRDPVTGDLTIYDNPSLMLASSTAVSPDLEGRVKAWFDAGELAYAYLGPDISATGLVVYAILPNFVRKNWRLGRNSFVYLDSCESGSAGAAPFREACFAVGAAGYAGWSTSVTDAWGYVGTTRYLFDLLIGESTLRPDISPPQRPFDLPAVLKALDERNLLVDPKSEPDPVTNARARFNYWPGPESNGSFRLLCPSIQRMEARESSDEIGVTGLFDPDAPTKVFVEFSGATFEVAPNQVRAGLLDFPLKGDGTPSVGNIYVSQNGRFSNTVPLTEWRVKGTMLKNPASTIPELSAISKLDLHFRADVHSFRLRPFEAPVFSSTGATIAKDSTGRLASASGTYNRPDGRSAQQWSLDQPVDMPFSNLRGILTIGDSGAASVFASIRTGNVMTVREFFDGELINTFTTEGGTGAAPGGTPTVLDFASYNINGASHVGAGDTGMFSIETAAPINPPIGEFAR